jgi:hypothetical protein
MPISLVRRLVKGSPLTAAEHDSNLDNIEDAVDASSSDLSYDAATRELDSSGGTPVTLPLATTTDAGLMAADDKTKIDGVASGATANSADATLLARANHTGTQAGSTITGAYSSSAMTVSGPNFLLGRGSAGAGPAEELPLNTNAFLFLNTPTSANLRTLLTDEVGTGAAYFVGGALSTPASGTLTNCTGLPSSGVSDFAAASRAQGEALLVAGTGVTLTPAGSGASRTITVASTATGTVTGVTGTAPIVSSGGAAPAISITAATTGAAGSMSSADKTKLDGVATGATANSADATLLARANHTGTQAGSSITGAYTSSAMTVSGNNVVLGRLTAGSGAIEELFLPAASFTFLGTPTSANLRAMLTDEVGTGVAYFVGGALGTPASGTLTSCTGLPVSTGISGLAANAATFLATPSSANLRAMLTDEVGTGAAYFVSGALGTPASGTLTNCTGLPSSGISDFNAASRAQTEAMLIAGTNITLTPGSSGATRTYTVATAAAVVTETGTQTLTNKTLGLTRESEFTITDAAAFEIDPNNGPLQTITLGANRTPAATNFANGMSVKLRINAGAFAITWSTVGVVWMGLTPGSSGGAPTLGTTGFTHIQLHREASVTYGTLIGYTAT